MAIEFFAAGDSINLANAASLSPGVGDFTVCARVRTDVLAASEYIIFLNTGAGVQHVGLIIAATNTFRAFYRDGDGDSAMALSVTALAVDTWYHVAAVRDGTTVYLYLDGEEDCDDTDVDLGDINVNGGAIPYIGRDVGVLKYWNGQMEDLRCYQRALAPGEIASLAAGYRDALGGEVGWWDMCSADGISVWDGAVLVEDTNYLPDLSVNSNVGNPVGNPIGRAGQCPGGKSHSKRQFLGLV